MAKSHARRPTIAFSAAEDERLARGWPHQVIFDGRADIRPEGVALSVARRKTELHGVWPREALHRYLRLVMEVRFESMGLRTLSKKAAVALATEGASSVETATSWLALGVDAFVDHDHARA